MKKNDKQDGLKRRDFMKRAGTVAAIAGAASAAPKLVRPAFAAKRDYLLVGRPYSATGPGAATTECSPWIDHRCVGEINEKGGIYLEEYGKQVPIKLKIVDTQSNTTKAAELAARLILKDKVDMMYVSYEPATSNPVSGVCDRYKMPCLASVLPNEMFLAGGPYHWAFCPSCRVQDYIASFLDMWQDIETNKKIGLVAANETDGIAFANGAAQFLPKAGYDFIDPGRFPEGTPDFTSLIQTFKKEKVEIVFGNLAPPDFTTVWRQCFQAGFIPKICTIGRAILLPAGVEALGGDLGLGTSTEALWHRDFPFKSSMKGYSGRDLTDAFETATGKEWIQVIGAVYMGYEVLYDSLRRAKTLDKKKIRQAIAETNLDTIGGHVKFKEDNVAVLPSVGIQWVKGQKYPFQCIIVANGNYPEMPIEQKMLSIEEVRK